MIHLCIASELEAVPFISGLDKISDGPHLYSCDNYKVLITGMGLVNTACSVSCYLQKLKDSQPRLINLGVAGAVNERLDLHSVHRISGFSVFYNSVVPQSSKGIMNQAYPSIIDNNRGLSLASSLHPVWDEDGKERLIELDVDLLDMEGYAFASACEQQGVEYEVYKSVSDYLSKATQTDFLLNARKAAEALRVFFEKQLL